MFRNTFTVLVIFLISSLIINAQTKRQLMGGKITGEVIDSQENVPMEFANVVVFSSTDSAQVTGTVTNQNGIFETDKIRPGSYYASISYIGFDEKIINGIKIKDGSVIDLGTVVLSPHTFDVDDVEVVADRAPISYEIDKKVINVSEQITARSGSAVDVLENVPSITVDIEGNVSLRGSGSFRVLIDGRPTIMEANEILQQIPASSIESIEIITNPSAKYDPEGTAGIINLVMKKNKNVGYSGLAELSGGLRNKYGGQLLGDYKTNLYTITLGVDYNNRNYYRNEEEINRTVYQGSTSFRNSYGESNHERRYFGLRGELGLNLSESDYLMFGSRYRDGKFGGNSTLNYSEWNAADANKDLYNSNSFRTREGNHYSFYINYDHRFNENGHILTAEIQYENENGDEETINELLDANYNITSGRKSTEAGPGSEMEAKLDYTLPLGGKTKFEAGYQNELDYSDEMTGLYDYNPASASYEIQPEFNREVKYKRNEHALYTIFASDWKELGYQFGFRAEYTDREIELTKTNNIFTIDRVDFFPSFHLSYQLGGGHQVMTSYTRRIDRPRGWYLEPFETWMDAYNVRTGNPALQPEYIDSYEMGYQALLGKTVFSIENYYRVNHNKIERIRSVYSGNVTLHTTENVGTDYSFGTELMFNFDPIENWNVNLMGNLYNYRIEGVTNNQEYSRESFNWNSRLNNMIKLWDATQLQFNLMYNSPSVSSQGTREGFFMTNIALRQDFFNRSLSATLQFRDIFGTAQYEYTSEAVNYYQYNFVTRESPMVMLNLRFTLNRQNRDRDRREGGDGMDFGGGEDF